MRVFVEDRAVTCHARITLRAEFGKETGLHGLASGHEGRISRQIENAIRVAVEIIEFFGGLAVKIEHPEGMIDTLSVLRENLGFGRPAVGIQVACDRVAHRPAARLKIVHVKKPIQKQAAGGITHIIRPSEIVPFLADDQGFAPGFNFFTMLVLQDATQTAALRRFHAGGRRRQTGNLEQSRGDINKAHIILHRPSGLCDARGPADRQRHVEREFVGCALGAGEGHAVV